jgi:hypothetical protein
MSDIYRYLFPCPRSIAADLHSSCTKPGGYVELAEAGAETFSDDNTIGEAFVQFHEYLNEAMLKIGRPPATAALLRQRRLECVGFVDVKVVDTKQPFGSWPKDQRMKTIGACFCSLRRLEWRDME